MTYEGTQKCVVGRAGTHDVVGREGVGLEFSGGSLPKLRSDQAVALES